MSDWLHVHRGEAPLVVAFPHGGSGLGGVEPRFASPWLARRDADWWIAELYEFVRELGATTIATEVSRAVIDVNRDPSGASLYPGMATTELCPTTTFDGTRLYRAFDPEDDEIAWRRGTFFDPYHAALAAEIARLRETHPRVVLYDAHSIRSRIPRLFEGALPQFNLGTNNGAACDPLLEAALSEVCAQSGQPWVANGRFKGGWTTRHYGAPAKGVYAVQMELAMRGYMDEPADLSEANWPAPLHENPAILPTLKVLIAACLTFAEGTSA
ncbi:N-formylglutamate deformylase [Novosphingobium sp.]|uniref:N-formylglutamate deformylase n=1 Tax=Novosphingobium sp. TaxID=1874826 RepID=UPI00286AA6E1|nr:N-formylglutamate deformylase [Novosphingobium sp.]